MPSSTSISSSSSKLSSISPCTRRKSVSSWSGTVCGVEKGGAFAVAFFAADFGLGFALEVAAVFLDTLGLREMLMEEWSGNLKGENRSAQNGASGRRKG